MFHGVYAPDVTKNSGIKKMRGLIENSVDEVGGVFYLRGHDAFNYSDGDRVENYIHSSIRKAKDISSKSRELEGYIKDWPTLYHLSRKRSLAYQSLHIGSEDRVLEIGCGCGSITRYLGEVSGSVLALEGSPRRAKITRERTRDLKTVKVLCAPFQDIQFKEQFDIVVCNGVLEYASLFTSGVNPHLEMLKRLSKLVKPTGSLVVAIENKTGLRYISSSKEEHTNIAFDGLEGYPRVLAGPQTFGLTELSNMLNKIFSEVEVLFPLPDYKLPVAIIREKLLRYATCAELYANTASHEHGSVLSPRMHERLVWHELEKTNLMQEMSNSLFLIGSYQESSLFHDDWLGDVYSISRKPDWTVRSRITISANGVSTKKEYIERPLLKGPCDVIGHRVVHDSWVNGYSTHTEIARALCIANKKTIEQRLREPVLGWWQLVKEYGVAEPNSMVSGEVVDLNWENSIVDSKTGEIRAIDLEWCAPQEVDALWLMYRTAVKFISKEVHYSHRWDKSCRSISPYRLIKEVGKINDVKVSMKKLYQLVSQECQLQNIVSGDRSRPIKIFIMVFEPTNLRRFRNVVLPTFRHKLKSGARLLRDFLIG